MVEIGVGSGVGPVSGVVSKHLGAPDGGKCPPPREGDAVPWRWGCHYAFRWNHWQGVPPVMGRRTYMWYVMMRMVAMWDRYMVGSMI